MSTKSCGSASRKTDSARERWEKKKGGGLHARGGIRTHDLRLRRPTLYPAELLARTTLGVVGQAGRTAGAAHPPEERESYPLADAETRTKPRPGVVLTGAAPCAKLWHS